MRLYTLENAEVRPVSHDPELKKSLLVPDPVSCVRHISHISLSHGSAASAHAHADKTEVFYCISGAVTFRVNSFSVLLKTGSCLVVEPGEEHAITEVSEPSEMVYMMLG